ncbi:MAG: glycerate kinase [Tissierellia bacterium]|nr:glycerate kinase [Tissierellia bacterium]
MKIIIASDSFKGSLTSMEVADAIEKGILRETNDVKIKKFSIADGGEGTVLALVENLGGEILEFDVTATMGGKGKGLLGIIDKNTAIIETASPCGLDKLDKNNLDPNNATSFGLGELILEALKLNLKKLYIGLGGSSVNDGGMGMAKALGAKFLDENDREIPKTIRGLGLLRKIDISNLNPALKNIEIELLSDVKNPLCGKNGATYVYGPQKGVKESELEEFDSYLKNYGKLLEKTFNKSIINREGAGAAGGLGAAFMAFTDCKMTRGIDKILELSNFEKAVKDCDMVFTGEGKMDFQSVFGKAPIGVANYAKKYDIPVIAIVGSTGRDIEKVYDYGIDLVLDIINKPMNLDYAMENAKILVEKAAYTAMKAKKI